MDRLKSYLKSHAKFITVFFLTASVASAVTTKKFFEPVQSTVSLTAPITNGGNLRLQSNTLSSTDTNGNIILDPNGSGGVVLTDQTATTVPYLDANKKLVSSAVTPTELDYLHSGGLPRSLLATGTADHVIINNGSGALSSEANLAISRGGTGAGTKAAAFDALSPMSASGDIIYGGASGTGTRLAKGSDGQVLKLSSGLPVWSTDATGSGTANVESISSTDSTDANNQIVLLSGASFTLTLHTAVGNTGQILDIIHSGTSLTQVYTLDTTSGQTIGGVASGAYALYTNGELLKIVSDGSNWVIIGRKTDTDWVDAGAITITATTTNPTKGTGTTRDQSWWRRQGRDVLLKYQYQHTVAGAAGSGDYLFALPANITADTTMIPVYTAAVGGGTSRSSNNLGYSQCAGSAGLFGFSSLYDSTKVRIIGAVTPFGAGNTVLDHADSAGNCNFGNAAVNLNINARIPVSGWQP